MPQLMPLPWFLSSLMILMLMFMFFNMYYMKLLDLLILQYNSKYLHEFKMKW